VVPERLTESLTTTGTLRANEEVEIVSEISGKISAIYLEEGSPVAAGELLLKIDDSELVAERKRATHRVELAERAEARQLRLLDDGVISAENYDVTLGELNVLRAELQLIEAQLLKTEIRSPFSGIIGLRWVSPGSYLSSQTRIASLHDLDPIKLDFTVPERYSALMKVGDEISFVVEGIERAFPGTVYAIEPSVDASTRSLWMRATCPNEDGALVPGMFANVELAVRTVVDALTVPSIAIIPELGGKKVFVYREGRAEPRTVETGIRSENNVQVTSGLNEGDLVITSGILQMQPGLEVELEETAVEPGSAP
jgi:membrane fusion protein (multidrug efflux system)